VLVEGERRWVLAGDRPLPEVERAETVQLLGPYDLFLQARDRPLLVEDPARSRALWPVLGRPGAVLVDGEVAGTWRPRTSGRKLTVTVDLWATATSAVRSAVRDRAERLAAHRHVRLADVVLA
jgi:DNA glycosylase AlkZ-like